MELICIMGNVLLLNIFIYYRIQWEVSDIKNSDIFSWLTNLYYILTAMYTIYLRYSMSIYFIILQIIILLKLHYIITDKSI